MLGIVRLYVLDSLLLPTEYVIVFVEYSFVMCAWLDRTDSLWSYRAMADDIQ